MSATLVAFILSSASFAPPPKKCCTQRNRCRKQSALFFFHVISADTHTVLLLYLLCYFIPLKEWSVHSLQCLSKHIIFISTVILQEFKICTDHLIKEILIFPLDIILRFFFQRPTRFSSATNSCIVSSIPRIFHVSVQFFSLILLIKRGPRTIFFTSLT